MPDPRLIQQLFGVGGLQVDSTGFPSQIRVEHGPLSRLPELFQQALLQDIGQLADRYRGPLSFGRGLRSPQTFDSQANAAGLLQLGLTVFFQDVSGTLPGAVPFLRELECELGVVEGSARLSAFASPEDDGVSCHYDAEEVISIQLVGKKTFYVAPMTEIERPYGAQFGPDMVAVENLFEQARQGFPDACGVTFERHEMLAGSVLFLPRGTWHRTEALEPSLALSIVIRSPVLADAVLRWLKPWLLGDARWRLPLYGKADPQDTGLNVLLGELATRLSREADTPSLSWNSAPSVDTTELLRIPGSGLTWQELPTSGQSAPRLRLQGTALDQDWRERLTLDTEIPGLLLPALGWLQQCSRAFDLDAISEHLPHIARSDLRQLLDLLVKSHVLRQLVQR